MANAASPASPGLAPSARDRRRRGRDSGKPRRPDIHPLDRAITELRNELARSPDNALLYGRLGALQYRRGDLVEAEASYRKAIALQPGRAAFNNNLGNVLCDLGRMKEGIACYEAAIAVERVADPERGPSEESLVNLELAKLEYRLVQERIEYLERAVQLEVDSAEAFNALGGGYLLRGNRDKALVAFRQAARLDPRDSYAARNIAFAHAIDLNGPSDLGEAREEIGALIRRHPDEARLYLHEGELLESAGLLEQAEERYARAAKADPQNLESYDLLGKLREIAGLAGCQDEVAGAVKGLWRRMEEEARGLQAKVGAVESARASLLRATACLARARFERREWAGGTEVQALLSAILDRAQSLPQEAAPVLVRAAVLYSSLLEERQQRAEAGRLLERLIEILPRSARLCFERAGLAYRQGEIERAVEFFERATLLDPQEAYAYQSLRFAFESLRRYRTERVRFNAAVREAPNNALAYHHFGVASLAVMKNQEALLNFEKALKLEPRMSDSACGCARALRRIGRGEDAERMFLRALEIDPLCQEAQQALNQIAVERSLKQILSSRRTDPPN